MGVDRELLRHHVTGSKGIDKGAVLWAVAILCRDSSDAGSHWLVLGDVEDVRGLVKERSLIVQVFDGDDDESRTGTRRPAHVDGQDGEAKGVVLLAIYGLLRADDASLVDVE